MNKSVSLALFLRFFKFEKKIAQLYIIGQHIYLTYCLQMLLWQLVPIIIHYCLLWSAVLFFYTNLWCRCRTGNFVFVVEGLISVFIYRVVASSILFCFFQLRIFGDPASFFRRQEVTNFGGCCWDPNNLRITTNEKFLMKQHFVFIISFFYCLEGGTNCVKILHKRPFWKRALFACYFTVV